jgi:2-oxo-4-hydroxy-4-carboxy-5-ureidoimidazoline decarboxylase
MTTPELNNLNEPVLRETLTKCCGASAWVEKMLRVFPVSDTTVLLAEAEKAWYACEKEDWLEAFCHHPRIGDLSSLEKKYGGGAAQWAASEQSSVNDATQEVLAALAEGNRFYEEKFGYIFIVCATGMSAMEMLVLLKARLLNDPSGELFIAMMEQNKITRIRLEKLASPGE